MDRALNCRNRRRFGVEVELNTSDGIVRKVDDEAGENPLGIELVATSINRSIQKPVEVSGWHHTHNNNNWVVKPDSSCGIEVCSPILKGWRGLSQLLKVVQGFRKDRLSSDNRCSLHVHLNISDMNMDQLASVVAWYIKCEHIFMDSVPSSRKMNRYCQAIGMTSLFPHNYRIIPEDLLLRVSTMKYYSINAYHFMKGGGFSTTNNRKETLESRIAESTACLNPYFVKNWVRLLLHFVEMTKDRPLPDPYKEGDRWSGLLWLDPPDMFEILGFDKPLSPGLDQVRRWFISRIYANGYNTGLPGIWSNAGRIDSRHHFLRMTSLSEIMLENQEVTEEMLFGKKYII